MTAIRPRRSVLSMPASNARAMEKAKTLGADCVLFDLEDGVAPETKDAARRQAAQALAAGGYGARETLIRVNPLSTPWGRADLEAARGAQGLVLTKLQSPAGLADVRAQLAAQNAAPIALWAMIETPLAVLNAKDIAAAALDAHYPLAAFILGPNDLAKQTRVPLAPGRMALLPWIAACVLAARAYGLDIIDGVFNDFKDEAGFEADCALGLALGMDGKQLIHPSQIGACNAAFSPADEDVAWARKVLAAFALPENAGKGVVAVDGQMVELLHAEMARRTLAISGFEA